MADIFRAEDFKALLTGKRIVFIGDSNMRAIYKDWVWLKQNNTIIPARCLKSKLESSFAGDSLLVKSALHNGRDFKEVREYQDESIYLHFMFVTKCNSDDVQNMFADFKLGKKPMPDIIIFNSCLWDLSRWGPDGVKMYQKNMILLLDIMKDSLAVETLVLFTTTLPVSLNMRGGFLVPDVDFLKSAIPYDVVEANNFIRNLVVAREFDVVDLHFHLRFQTHRRNEDGVHWEPIVIRHLTNLLLTHISMSRGVKLPGHARGHSVTRIQSVESGNLTRNLVDCQPTSSFPTPKLKDVQERNSSKGITCSNSDGKLAHNNCKGGKSICSDPPCSRKGSKQNAPVMENLCETRVELNVKSKGSTSSQVLVHNASVMENLYNTSASSYENHRGGMSSHGVGQTRPQTSGGQPLASKKKLPRQDSYQQKKQNKFSIHGRRGRDDVRILQGQNLKINCYTQNQAQNYPQRIQPQNQGVIHHQQQQHKGHLHVGGMHVSNYVGGLYPTNEAKAQFLLDSHPVAHDRGKPYNYNSRGFWR